MRGGVRHGRGPGGRSRDSAWPRPPWPRAARSRRTGRARAPARMPRRFEPQSLTTPMRMPSMPRTSVSIGSTSGKGSQASGENWLARIRSSTSACDRDPDPPEHDRVVRAPVLLDPPVVGPGVVAGSVVLVPEPAVRLFPGGVHLVLGDGMAVLREHVTERIGKRAARREQGEPGIEAEQPVGHASNGSALLRPMRGAMSLATPPTTWHPSDAGFSPGTPSSAGTSRGAPRPIRTPSSSARSCSSRPRPRAWPSDSSGSSPASPTRHRWRPPRRRRCSPSGAGSATTAARWRCARRRRPSTRDGWPRDVEGLTRLPGVGPYTARAVASLAFGVPVGVVDTNVRRWLAPPLRPPGRAAPPAAARRCARRPGPRPRTSAAWTHASMELGASVCRARAPRCDACPVAHGCPSRGAAAIVPVARQAPLRGSTRAYRGALLRELAHAPGHRLGEREARKRVARRRWPHRAGARCRWLAAHCRGPRAGGPAPSGGAGHRPGRGYNRPSDHEPRSRRPAALGRTARHRRVPAQPAQLRHEAADRSCSSSAHRR